MVNTIGKQNIHIENEMRNETIERNKYMHLNYNIYNNAMQ